MELYVLCSSSSTSILHPVSSKVSHSKRRIEFKTQRKRSCTKISVANDDFNGEMIDENMIVLRKRIREMKMEEEEMDEVPSEWIEWEKRYVEHGNYDRDVFEAVGILQRLLMNTRPGLAMGIMGLVLLSLSSSSVVVVAHLVELAKWVASTNSFKLT